MLLNLINERGQEGWRCVNIVNFAHSYTAVLEKEYEEDELLLEEGQ